MVQKGQHPVFMCGIFCCILIFISGTTHMIAVPFITAVIGYGAGALVCRTSRKQQLWCVAVSAVFTAAVLPISGIHRRLLQSQSTQVSRWGFPQYLFLLAGLLPGLMGGAAAARKLPEKAALAAAALAVGAAVGALEPFLTVVLMRRLDLGGGIWSMVWTPLAAGVLAGGAGSLCTAAARTHRRFLAVLQLVLLAAAALSVFRGLRADFFWSKSWGTFFFSYPFVSGACLGCLAQTAEAAKGQ